MTETYKAGAITYATAMAFNWVGGLQLPAGLAVAAHAAVGCASAAASGGNCGNGALAAGFGKLATLGMPTPLQENHVYQLTYVSVVGGTASVLGGGKFGNGATTAAFVYLYKAAPKIYKDIVGYGLDMGLGGDAVLKGFLTPPVEGANNVGTQGHRYLDPDCLFCEGGIVSRFMNQIYGINATAGLHDTMQINLGTGLLRDIANVPLMPVAALGTYSAAFGQMLNSLPSSTYIYSLPKKDTNGRSEYRPPIMIW